MTTDVFFATNRQSTRARAGDFGERFHADGPRFYRVGRATVTGPAAPPRPDADPIVSEDGYAVASVRVYAERKPDAVTGTGGRLGSDAMFREIRAALLGDHAGTPFVRDVLVFVHGFANTFHSGLVRAAILGRLYRVQPTDGRPEHEPVVLAFGWPANGRVQPPWEYHSDRSDAADSGAAMARAMQRFADFLAAELKELRRRRRSEDEPAWCLAGRCEADIHLVAHSMGNWALRHAVQSLKAIRGESRVPKIFQHAFLMCADDDHDTLSFEDRLGPIVDLAEFVHVYHSREDRALAVSDKTKFNPNRLGTHGPKTFSGLSNQVVAVDCDRVDWTELADGRHQYYWRRWEVIADVRRVLAGQRPDQIETRDTVESGRRYRIRG